MRRISLVLLLLLGFCVAANAQENALKGTNMSLGLGMPLLGWTTHNDNGEVTKTIGINPLLGITVKSYWNPVKTSAFNPFLSYGTVLVLLPYIGIGGDYVFNNGFYIGAGTIYVAPEVHLGFMF